MEFKYLVNPTKEDFCFQFNGDFYEVKASTRKLFPKVVAEHGARRSIFLSDPMIDEETNEIISNGNDVYQKCTTEEAQIESQIKADEPILVQSGEEMLVTSNPHNIALKNEAAMSILAKKKKKAPAAPIAANPVESVI